MRFAVFGKEPTKENIPFIQELFSQLLTLNEKILVWNKFYSWIKDYIPSSSHIQLFSNREDLKDNADILFYAYRRGSTSQQLRGIIAQKNALFLKPIMQACDIIRRTRHMEYDLCSHYDRRCPNPYSRRASDIRH